MKILFQTCILFLLIFISCKNDKAQSTIKTAAISFTKNAELQLIKGEKDSIIKILDIEIADDEYKTQTGLMYRKSMEENQGMLFIFPDAQVRSFYMKNTEIALDIIYINANKQIVSFQKNAIPFDVTSLPSLAPAQYVLEINAGLSDLWNLEVGDKIVWEKI
ncbi:MAG: hypothetical protein CVU03_08825 [Bacteroidetes bacterium HGW-Bacteroidetes-2]|jgi:hypothetical protein|nr:MAG: hypothetical protein CVU03_08825 [Bacteroidetes bacterium HGW-Bacteroidetes-2]